MNIKIVFNTLIDSVESNYTLECLERGLYETKLITPSFHSGSLDARKKLKKEISRTDLDDTTGMKSTKISKINLSKIYSNKQGIANKLLHLSLVNIGISLALIFIGLLIILIEKSQVKLGIIISLCSMLPWLVSVTAFWFYRNENNHLKAVEQDIREIAKLELFLEMMRYISDEKEKSEAYENYIKGIDKRKNPFKKILILSANPEDTSRLRLDKEVREIEEGLNWAPHRDKFHIQSKWAVSFWDLRRALLKYKPQIVHFAGHGEEEGLMVESDEGPAVPISSKALSGLFELCSHHVECVILNACYSALQADTIIKHINYVIGMPGKIDDQAAIEFAVGFYDALGAGNTVEKAFKFGCNAIEQVFPDLPQQLIPVLKKSIPRH